MYPLGNTPSAPSERQDHLPHGVHPLLHRPDLLLLSQHARGKLTQPPSCPCVSLRLLPTKIQQSVGPSLQLRHPILQTPDPLRGVIRFPVQPLQLHVRCILVPTHLSLRKITKAAGLVEDNGAQGTGVFHGQLQGRVGLFLTRVVTNYATTEGGALIRIEVMTTKLSTSDPTDRVDEVGPVQIFEPILVRIVGVGTTVEVVSRRVLPTLFVTCIL